MENAIKIDEKIVEKIAKKTVILEKGNLKTRELTDAKIVLEIKKIIEEEVEID
ncbi:hypothetical protein [Fusobacterium sp.]|uniref:hypothetical protein n=1 Tax=unclassified Fusobacterium TaxID=2648384 RepID=UPI00261D0F48|nr:hypothetical protein [Fusobacterium sp.]